MTEHNKPNKQNNQPTIPPVELSGEEEYPGTYNGTSNGNNGSKKKKRKPSPINTEDIQTQKYRSAISITGWCIALVIVVWLLDMVASGISYTVGGVTLQFDTTHTTTVIDLLKYVVTASLSFFFGTSVNKDKP